MFAKNFLQGAKWSEPEAEELTHKTNISENLISKSQCLLCFYLLLLLFIYLFIYLFKLQMGF
jgi:hypothetical protein